MDLFYRMARRRLVEEGGRHPSSSFSSINIIMKQAKINRALASIAVMPQMSVMILPATAPNMNTAIVTQ